jgi:hypothetical protein
MAVLSDQVDAGRIASIADILDVRLFESSSKLLETDALNLPLSFEIEVNPIIEYDAGSPYFVLRVKYSIRISSSRDTDSSADDEHPAESADDSNAVAQINFDFGALYRLELEDGDLEVRQEELDAYARTAGIMCIHPYAREHVNYITQQFSLPRLILPIVKLPLMGSPEVQPQIKLVLWQQETGAFRFAVRSRDDKSLATSSTYKSRASALEKTREILSNFPGIEFVDLTGAAENGESRAG